jgi:hypothetical protein
LTLVWLALAAIAVWALVRLGRQGERRGRGHWRVTATLFSAVMIAGAVLLAARGAWLPAAALGGAGVWLTLSSRQRAPVLRSEAMSPAEARALLTVGETPIGNNLDPVELAQWTLVSSQFFNLDEFLTK